MLIIYTISKMDCEQLCVKNPESLIVHSGQIQRTLNHIIDLNSYEPLRFVPCVSMAVSKTISLNQQPEETALLEFSLGPKEQGFHECREVFYSFSLTFKNSLHEVSQDYGYEIDFYIYAYESQLSTHTLLFSEKIIRKTNNIRISNSYKSNVSRKRVAEFHKKLIKRTFDARHMCCNIRRFNVSVAETMGKRPIQNTYFGARLFETEYYSDVSLIVGQASFSVHKHVLSEASRVFKAMFTHDMIENQKGKVVIDGFDPAVIREFLTFIYTGNTSFLAKNPTKLYELAHIYDIQDLKIKCMEYFIFTVNFTNVVDMLRTARLYELVNLEKDLMKFIAKHEEKLVREASYQKYLCEALEIDRVTSTLKLCIKYGNLLKNVETFTFQFVKSNNKALVSNTEFLRLFKTHPGLMTRLYVFIHQ